MWSVNQLQIYLKVIGSKPCYQLLNKNIMWNLGRDIWQATEATRDEWLCPNQPIIGLSGCLVRRGKVLSCLTGMWEMRVNNCQHCYCETVLTRTVFPDFQSDFSLHWKSPSKWQQLLPFLKACWRRAFWVPFTAKRNQRKSEVFLESKFAQGFWACGWTWCREKPAVLNFMVMCTL